MSRPDLDSGAPLPASPLRAGPADGLLARLLGGPPTAVLMRLVIASLLVGAVLIWLDVRPADIFAGVHALATRIWGMGFDAFREAGQYIAVGAMIVVPFWLLMRLLRIRGRR